MKLLFDQNLSYRLVELLDDIFPGSVHVRELNLHEAGDLDIWDHAKNHNLVIVTQDSDFAEWNKIRGAPPKIIWIRCGNASVEQIHAKLRHAEMQISLMLDREAEIDVVEIW